MQFLTLSVQIGVLFGTFREGYVRQFFQIGIGNRHVETIADVANAVHVHFLNLVSDVLTFSSITHAVTFDGMGEDDGRFAFGFLRFLQCSVNFLRIVAAAVQSPNLLVSPVGNQRGGLRIFTEEVLAHISAVFDLKVW